MGFGEARFAMPAQGPSRSTDRLQHQHQLPLVADAMKVGSSGCRRASDGRRVTTMLSAVWGHLTPALTTWAAAPQYGDVSTRAPPDAEQVEGRRLLTAIP